MLETMGVMIFRQTTHSGGGAARNRGARECTGTHVCFLDSDDVWMPGRGLRLQAFYSRDDNDRTILVSSALLHDDGEVQKPFQPEWKTGSSLIEYVYRDMGRVQTSMMCVPVDLVRAYPWNEDLRVNQDTDLAMRMSRAGVGFHIDQEPGIIKDETLEDGRVTTGRETADRSYAWYQRESGDWSPAARSGYHLQDRVWRLADAGRRREGFVALANTLNPPVCLRESARRALAMLSGPRVYKWLRTAYRGYVGHGRATNVALRSARQRWRDLDARAKSLCDAAQVPVTPSITCQHLKLKKD
ncbi:glycosyltransferase family 2 protein [Paracoccus nototheniae]